MADPGMMATMHKRVAAVWVCVGLAMGCGGKKDDSGSVGEGTTDKGGDKTKTGDPATNTALAPTDAGANAKPKVEAEPRTKPTKKQLKNFRQHLAEGRSLAKAKKYDEAIAMFEKALTFEPENARAWSELGFARYKVLAIEKSIEASEASIRLAKDPRVKAASGYNLGLALEASKKPDEARRVYLESLEMRPNQTVLDRYKKVGGTSEVWAFAPTCGAAPVTEAELCKCFVDAAGELEEPEETTCIPGLEAGDEFFVYWVGPVNTHRDRGFLDGYLGRKVGDKLQLLANVVSNAWYGPKNVENYELHEVKQLTVGDRGVWRIEGTYVRGDEDFMTLVETSRQRRVTFCVEDGARPKCSIGFATGGSWTATIGPYDIDDPDNREWFTKEYGDTPPISWEYTLDVSLGDDGKVVTRATKGLGEYSATYSLW